MPATLCDIASSYGIAVQTSTAIYGANVLLGSSCLYLLISSTRLRKDQLTKVVALCLYVSAVLGFASQAVVHVSQIMLGEAGQFIAFPHSLPGTTIWGGSQPTAMSLPLAILGADGFMVYTIACSFFPRPNFIVFLGVAMLCVVSRTQYP